MYWSLVLRHKVSIPTVQYQYHTGLTLAPPLTVRHHPICALQANSTATLCNEDQKKKGLGALFYWLIRKEGCGLQPHSATIKKARSQRRRSKGLARLGNIIKYRRHLASLVRLSAWLLGLYCSLSLPKKASGPLITALLYDRRGVSLRCSLKFSTKKKEEQKSLDRNLHSASKKKKGPTRITCN